MKVKVRMITYLPFGGIPFPQSDPLRKLCHIDGKSAQVVII